MEGVAARVQVNADRTINVQLPDGLPAGEYEAVLIPVKKSSEATFQTKDIYRQKNWDGATDEFWNQWLEDVEQIPLSPQPARSEYHKSLIEKYRRQGLDL